MQTIEPVEEGVQGRDAPKPQTLAQCHEVIDTLMQRVAELQREVAWLHERVTLNSKTSFKPPSSDGPGSGNRAQRRASQRKRGAQKGHPGSYRALVEEARVDQIVDCAAPEVCECGAPVTPAGQPVRHQVFEIPEVRAHVSEYRLGSPQETENKARHDFLDSTGSRKRRFLSSFVRKRASIGRNSRQIFSKSILERRLQKHDF